MTPWQLEKSGSEHAEQTALFCYLAKAQIMGFERASNPAFWDVHHTQQKLDEIYYKPVPELRWLHAIPNGGNRGDTAKSRAIEGGRMKAEGVKPGVHDICWPLSKKNHNAEYNDQYIYCGLYIELKRKSLKRANDPHAGCSQEQKEFGQFVHDNGFFVIVCYGWLEAAKIIQAYYEGKL